MTTVPRDLPAAPPPSSKKVGALLGLGILLFPYLFSWLTLQKGYSAGSRILAFFWLFVVVSIYNHSPGTSSQTVSSNSGSGTTSGESPKDEALRLAKLDYSWAKEGFGNIMMANFTVTNPSKYRLKDLKITCNHFAKSGTEIDKNSQTIYDVIKPGQKKHFPNVNMGFIHTQAASSYCKIVDLETAGLY